MLGRLPPYMCVEVNFYGLLEKCSMHSMCTFAKADVIRVSEVTFDSAVESCVVRNSHGSLLTDSSVTGEILPVAIRSLLPLTLICSFTHTH